jgi:hypothetical protein
MAKTPIEIRDAAIQLRGIAIPTRKAPILPGKATIRFRVSPC